MPTWRRSRYSLRVRAVLACGAPLDIVSIPIIHPFIPYRRSARSTSLPPQHPSLFPALVSALFVPLFTSGGFAAYLRCGHLPRFSILGSGSCLLFTSGVLLFRGVGRSIWRYFYRHYPHRSSSVAPIANRHSPHPAGPALAANPASLFSQKNHTISCIYQKKCSNFATQ